MEKAAILNNINTEEKTVILFMTYGDQIVNPSANKSMSKVTIEKPDTLKPKNIIEGVNIGGVTGSIKVYPTYHQEAALDMTAGDQQINALDGKLMTKVTIYRCPDLMPDNIKNGITIAGVTGTYDPTIGYEEKEGEASAYNDVIIAANDGKYLSKATIKQVKPLNDDYTLEQIVLSGYNVAGVSGKYLGEIRVINVNNYSSEADILSRFTGYIKATGTLGSFKSGRIYYINNSQIQNEWEDYRIKT